MADLVLATEQHNDSTSYSEPAFHLEPAEKATRIIIGTLVFIENCISLYALRHASSMQTSLRYSLTSLSLADVLCGLMFVYQSIVMDMKGFSKDSSECWMRHIIFTSVTIITLATIATLTLDRIFALFHPFGYRHFATKSSFIVVHITEWLLSTGVTMTAYAVGNFHQNVCHFGKMASTGTYVILLIVRCSMVVIIVSCQIIMFCLARRHIKKIVPILVGPTQVRAAVRMNIKAILTTSAIVLPFIVCVAPLYIGYVYAAIKPEITQGNRWKMYLSVAISIFMVNGAIHPVIYCWRLPEIRRVLKGLFCKRLANTNRSLPSTNVSTLKPSITAISEGKTPTSERQTTTSEGQTAT